MDVFHAMITLTYLFSMKFKKCEKKTRLFIIFLKIRGEAPMINLLDQISGKCFYRDLKFNPTVLS